MAGLRGSPPEHGASDRSASKPVDGEPKPLRAPKTTAGTKPGKVKEIGGPKGPEPTRYGDWEKGGRCSDF